MMHSDGNMMGILYQIPGIGPDILQSIDPMAGMDIRQVKQIAGKRMSQVSADLRPDGFEFRILSVGP